MKYKAGDEVLIKAKIGGRDDCSNGPLPYGVYFKHGGSTWVSEKDIVEAKTYTDGMTDAWELAKKILFKEYGYSAQQIYDIFGDGAMQSVKKLTIEEALAKIEAYERTNEIKVGDEVVLDGDEEKTVIIVTRICGSFISGFDKDGKTHSYIFPNRFIQKTGKHIDIESVLKEIGE